MKEKHWVGVIYGVLTVTLGIIGYGTTFTIPISILNIRPIYMQILFSLIVTAMLSILWIYYYYEFIRKNQKFNSS
jgi:hypothetical protein